MSAIEVEFKHKKLTWKWDNNSLWLLVGDFRYRCINIKEVYLGDAIPQVAVIEDENAYPWPVLVAHDQLQEVLAFCPYTLPQLSPTWAFERERESFFAYLRERPWGRLANKYIKKFEKQREKFMDRYGITQELLYAEEWTMKLIEQRLIKEKQLQGIQGPLKDIIEKIISGCGVEPQYIQLFHSNPTIDNDSGACFSYIRLTRDLWARFLKPTILHELIHLLNLDWSISMVQKKHNPKTEACQKWQERQADILSSLTSLDAVQLEIGYRKKCLNKCNHKFSEHPTCIERHTYLVKLQKQMLEATERDVQKKARRLAALKQDALKKAAKRNKKPCALKPIEQPGQQYVA